MTIDHVALAIARLPQQFRGKPNIEAWLSALVRPLNDVQQAVDDLRRMRRIDDATGVWLDRIGKKVVQLRGDLDDDTYRRYLRARIATSKSRGTPRELVSIAQAILGAGIGRIVLDNQGYAAVVIEVEGVDMTDAIASALFGFLSIAAAAGVRVVLQTSSGDEDDFFAMAEACFINAGASIGEDSIAIDDSIVDTSGFPASGSIVVDAGTAIEETLAYGSKSESSFLNLTPVLVYNHVAGAPVALVGEPGAGLGDYYDSDVGGQLDDAWDTSVPAITAPEGTVARTLGALTGVAAGTAV